MFLEIVQAVDLIDCDHRDDLNEHVGGDLPEILTWIIVSKVSELVSPHGQ